MLKNTITSDEGYKIDLTFTQTDSYEDYDNLTQAYGLCFTKDGKFIVGKHKFKWTLPGGTIDPDEKPEETLIRELDEELSLKVLDFKLIGIQNVKYLKGKNKKFGSNFNQTRYFCLVELKELTPDPDKNILWERKLINPEEFTKYIPWGSIGEKLIELAKKEFKKIN